MYVMTLLLLWGFQTDLPPMVEQPPTPCITDITTLRMWLREMVRTPVPVEEDTPEVAEVVETVEIPEVREEIVQNLPEETVPEEVPVENVEPALLAIEEITAEPIQLVNHEEPQMPEVVNSMEVPAESKPAIIPQPVEIPEPEAPPVRPWGVLTAVVFLFLLSLSGNVFLGWQLWEEKRRKDK